ncbi:MAG: hypothetical protein Q8Q39_01755 [bacterium]|nr:hypothetical protein [bacterium]
MAATITKRAGAHPALYQGMIVRMLIVAEGSQITGVAIPMAAHVAVMHVDAERQPVLPAAIAPPVAPVFLPWTIVAHAVTTEIPATAYVMQLIAVLAEITAEVYVMAIAVFLTLILHVAEAHALMRERSNVMVRAPEHLTSQQAPVVPIPMETPAPMPHVTAPVRVINHIRFIRMERHVRIRTVIHAVMRPVLAVPVINFIHLTRLIPPVRRPIHVRKQVIFATPQVPVRIRLMPVPVGIHRAHSIPATTPVLAARQVIYREDRFLRVKPWGNIIRGFQIPARLPDAVVVFRHPQTKRALRMAYRQVLLVVAPEEIIMPALMEL